MTNTKTNTMKSITLIGATVKEVENNLTTAIYMLGIDELYSLPIEFDAVGFDELKQAELDGDFAYRIEKGKTTSNEITPDPEKYYLAGYANNDNIAEKEGINIAPRK